MLTDTGRLIVNLATRRLEAEKLPVGVHAPEYQAWKRRTQADLMAAFPDGTKVQELARIWAARHASGRYGASEQALAEDFEKQRIESMALLGGSVYELREYASGPSAESDVDLLACAVAVKDALVCRATGRPSSDSTYAQQRARLVASSECADLVPSFVKTCRTLDEFWDFIKPKFPTYAERREFLREAFDPILSALEGGAISPLESQVDGAVAKLGSVGVQALWRKALDRCSRDPDGAITAARSMLESVCKHVLDDAQVGYGDSEDLPSLYHKAAESVGLAPEQYDAPVFRKVLGNCQSVVNGMAEIRNKMGDSHGIGRRGYRPLPRHARLVANLCGTMAAYLLETRESR